MECNEIGADGDCGDYHVGDGGGSEKYIMIISLINGVDDEYLNSYLLGSQT